MIKPTELRIGNLVYEEGEELTKIIHGWQMDEGMELFPIPLTREWLIKFGFASMSIMKWSKEKFDIQVANIDGKIVYMFWGYLIGYVHQLQNLYFDLTGEELEIKY